MDKFDWEYFKEYVETYNPEKDGNNDPDIILKDMLYGLGTAIQSEEYKFFDGFKRFKMWLKEFIDE